MSTQRTDDGQTRHGTTGDGQMRDGQKRDGEQTQDTAGRLEIMPGDEREGGWREFAEARETGEQRIDAFVRARQAFERTALENDVLG